MPIDSAAAPSVGTPAASSVLSLLKGIVQRPDGVYVEPAAFGPTLLASLDALVRGGSFLAGVEYPVLMKVLFGHGAVLPSGDVRIARDIRTFDLRRRALYRAVKIVAGRADYVFEPVWLADAADPDGQGQPARLDVDEFIADMWLKGIRFGLDIGVVRAAIAADRAEHVTVAERLAPEPGVDARIDEVSDDIHRSDAPRQLANGRLDLSSFQNRFPQIRPGKRLLKKIPATSGKPGFELSGAVLPAKAGADVDLVSYAGEGTAVETNSDGEFLMSCQAGFLQVDAKTSRISVNVKVISRDGVSARTTGNLSLTGDYEEFGDVQEKRVVEGESIVVHGNVFGRVVSRRGTVTLLANLMGGSAYNKRGDIVVRGVASGAVVQASQGAVTLERAENCVISGTKVTIGHAINCEIIGDDVTVGQAEGSAVAGRRVTIDACAPRKQGEMLVAVLCPEGAQIDEVIAMLGKRVAQFAELAARHRVEMQQATGHPDVRRYLSISGKVRKNEIVLNADQQRQFQKMAQDVGPLLKAIGDVSARVKAAEAEQRTGQEMLDKLEAQRRDVDTVSAVTVRQVQGDTQVRVLGFNPAGGSPYDLAPRDIRMRLRGPQHGALLFSGRSGTVEWNGAPEVPDSPDAPAPRIG